MNILNLTQHPASPEQREAGVKNYHDIPKLKELLTFNDLPTKETVQERADELADLASDTGYQTVMIGGAPFLMKALHCALVMRGLNVCYAFSQRVSVEKVTESGETVKQSVFKHLGFI